MNSIISFFLSFLVFLGTIMSSGVKVEAPEDTGDFTPVLRFVVSSDSHVKTMGDRQTRRLQQMVKLGYAIAQNDEEYNKLDAVLMAGDLTDDGTKLGFASYAAAVDAVLEDGTQFLSVVARSHDSSSMDENAIDYFTAVTGQPSDFHTVINGFHFIGLSRSSTPEHYAQYQKDWLREQLDEAVEDDPFKPIFVMQHEHISDTVYGSSDFEGWGMPDFREVLEDYPQVIDFSGHSHYPINDARSIWQNEFTAVGTGGLYYVELTVDDERTVHPQGHKKVASFWVVEVDANNRIRMRAVDLGAEEYLCEYNLNTPFDRSYSRAAQLLRSRKPEFKAGTTLDIKGKKVTFAAAESKDGMPIFMYRAYAVDAEGNRTPVGKTLPEYYNYDVPDTVTIKLENLPDGDYVLEVVAENCFGMQSEPIKSNSDNANYDGLQIPVSKNEIVNYFNKAVNDIKVNATSVTQNYETNYVASDVTVPGSISAIYKLLGGDMWLDGMLADNSKGAATYTGADIAAKFPVEGESWASKLTADDVVSATCTISNGVYTISIVTKADDKSDSVQRGQGHNPKAFNVVLPGVVNDNVPGIAANILGTAAMSYPAGKVTITVDAFTGKVKTADYDIQWTINFDKIGCIIPLGTKSSYTINW